MKLAIISHTEHYTADDGTLVGWSPTVNEINHLLDVFDSIYHLAMYDKGPAPKSVMPYASNRIKFIKLPTVGGPRLSDKMRIIWHAPTVVRTVSRVLKEVDYFQLRTPTGIGVFLIPYLTVFSKSKGWYKYAGNWNQEHPPLGYALQRWFLKHQSRKITINGQWDNQHPHCISFENPCLTDEDIQEGIQLFSLKPLPFKRSVCFVGRMEPDKGVDLIFEALAFLSPKEKIQIDTIHFVGDGPLLSYYKSLTEPLGIQFKFHGVLSRHEVFAVYKTCQVLLLPSKSEGFPKVVSEAMNFCCVPVVSRVSSIGQYIQHNEHGFLIEPLASSSLLQQLRHVLNLNEDDYFRLIENQRDIVKKFTFSHYIDQLKQKVL